MENGFNRYEAYKRDAYSWNGNSAAYYGKRETVSDSFYGIAAVLVSCSVFLAGIISMI